MRSRFTLLAGLPLVAIAVCSFVIVRGQQGAGAVLVSRQQSAQALTATAVARVVRLAPEDVGGPAGRWASCVPLGAGELRNPWRCTIGYPAGLVDRYLVTINVDGSFTGDHQLVRQHGHTSSGPGEISGCCVAVP